MRSRILGRGALAGAAITLLAIPCVASVGSGWRSAPGFAGSPATSVRVTEDRNGPSRNALSSVPRNLTKRSLTAIDAGCILFTDRAATATSQDCLTCHETGTGGATALNRCHPVEITYSPSPESLLRSAEEVIRRGVFLPDGRIRCVTCHDGSSPWDVALALPPGSSATAAVNPRDPRTYDPANQQSAPQPGDRVSPRPLCLACHAFD